MLTLIVLSLSWLTFSPTARAHDRSADESPSVFSYGYRGFFSGALVGIGTGYLVTRPGGIESEDWRTLVFAGGIGALTGSAVGIGLGVMDLSIDQPGRARLVLRDTAYGATFGLFAGAATGGLAALKTNEGEHVLFGMAIGTIAGAGLGLAVGFIEGERVVDRRARQRDRDHRRGLTASVSTTEDVAGGLVWMPSIAGRM